MRLDDFNERRPESGDPRLFTIAVLTICLIGYLWKALTQT